MNLSKQLHNLGKWTYSHPWQVIAAWLSLIGIFGFTAFTFMQPTSSSISIPGTEAQKAIDRVSEIFPESGGATGRIVFESQNGTLIKDQSVAITKLTDRVAEIDGVTAVATPFTSEMFISESQTIGFAQVQLDGDMGSVSSETIEAVEAAVEQARSEDLTIEVGGALVNKMPGEIIGVGEIFGVVIALVVLVMTLGSLIAAGMPIITALVGIIVSAAGLFSLSNVIEINATTPVLAIMLGLAVGIDYALFIINKYRYYLKAGYANEQAAAKATGTAGNAVIFAAATVIIALAALSVVNIPFMTTMGLAGAASIAVAALVAVTLIPALLRLAGNRIFHKKQRKGVEKLQSKANPSDQAFNKQSFWYRWGETITRHPWIFLATTVAIIAVIALPARDLTLGLPTDQYAATSSSERKAYDLLAKGFGPGFNGPLTVVVEGLPATSQADRTAIRDTAMQQFTAQAEKAAAQQQQLFAQKIASATTPEQQLAVQQEIAAAQAAGEIQKKKALAEIEKSITLYAKFNQLNIVSDEIKKLDNVAASLPVQVTDDGTKGIIQVTPTSAPADTATVALINTLRDPTLLSLKGSTSLAVTGAVALEDDINNKLSAALPVYLFVVVGLSLLLLIVAFRSILVPVKATVGFLLSVAAMFGALVAVFQWGWLGIAEAPGPIVSFIPIIAIGVLFGLAMDYEFFLVSGMHEAYEHNKKNPRAAVVHGFGMGAKVVTAAGAIMVSVFASFIFNHDATIQAIGFALAVGILIDAFLVRMTIVPAVMTLLGKNAWWLPKWLQKHLPHLSIEGEE